MLTDIQQTMVEQLVDGFENPPSRRHRDCSAPGRTKPSPKSARLWRISESQTRQAMSHFGSWFALIQGRSRATAPDRGSARRGHAYAA